MADAKDVEVVPDAKPAEMADAKAEETEAPAGADAEPASDDTKP